MWTKKMLEARKKALRDALREDEGKLRSVRSKCAEEYNRITKAAPLYYGPRGGGGQYVYDINSYTDKILDSMMSFRCDPRGKYIREVVIHQDKPSLFFPKKCIKIAVAQAREIHSHMAATVARVNKQYDEKEQAEEAQRAKRQAELHEWQKQHGQPDSSGNKFWMTSTYDPDAYYSVPLPLRDYARDAGLSYGEIENNILGG
jgi:hypothetical protein